MLDPRREVLKVETEEGDEFVLREDLDELERKHTIVSQETLIPAGSMGLFSGREGREYGFVKLLASDRGDLARGLALPPDAVIEDQALVGDWRPVLLNIEGPIEPHTVRQLNTLIGTELRDRKVNWIGLTIDSTGGALEDCLRLADTIAALDANEVHTVAYVPADASGGAALVALACDQLVMHPEANLGGKGTVELDRQTLDEATVSIRDSLSKNTDQSWSVLAAMIDPDLELFTYNNTKTGEVRHFSPEEADQQPDADDWKKGPQVKQAGEPLRLAANRAHELDIATHVVDSFDEFKQLYGFENDPRVAEPNWALELVEALSSPALAVMLLVIGFVGIYVELHTPGVGVGAFVAALAFMLFFWSNFLHGTAGWLEVLLFLGGVAFLLLELSDFARLRRVRPGRRGDDPGFARAGQPDVRVPADRAATRRNAALADDRGRGHSVLHRRGDAAAPLPAVRALVSHAAAESPAGGGIGGSRLSRIAGRFFAPDRPARHCHDQSHASRQGRLRRPAGRRHRRRHADRPRSAGGGRQDPRQPRDGPLGECVNQRAVLSLLTYVCPAKS